jgi:hypothetical protein
VEALVRGSELPVCPLCGCRDLERLISSFAVSSQATRSASLNRERRSNERTQRDRAIAEREESEHHHH